MFQTSDSKVKAYQTQIDDLKSAHSREIADLNSAHARAVLDYEKKLEYVSNDEILKLKAELAKTQQDLAVITEANKHLEKMTDINADIIDVKDVVNKLIEKLPEINLTSLTVQGNNK